MDVTVVARLNAREITSGLSQPTPSRNRLVKQTARFYALLVPPEVWSNILLELQAMDVPRINSVNGRVRHAGWLVCLQVPLVDATREAMLLLGKLSVVGDDETTGPSVDVLGEILADGDAVTRTSELVLEDCPALRQFSIYDKDALSSMLGSIRWPSLKNAKLDHIRADKLDAPNLKDYARRLENCRNSDSLPLSLTQLVLSVGRYKMVESLCLAYVDGESEQSVQMREKEISPADLPAVRRCRMHGLYPGQAAYLFKHLKFPAIDSLKILVAGTADKTEFLDIIHALDCMHHCCDTFRVRVDWYIFTNPFFIRLEGWRKPTSGCHRPSTVADCPSDFNVSFESVNEDDALVALKQMVTAMAHRAAPPVVLLIDESEPAEKDPRLDWTNHTASMGAHVLQPDHPVHLAFLKGLRTGEELRTLRAKLRAEKVWPLGDKDEDDRRRLTNAEMDAAEDMTLLRDGIPFLPH